MVEEQEEQRDKIDEIIEELKEELANYFYGSRCETEGIEVFIGRAGNEIWIDDGLFFDLGPEYHEYDLYEIISEVTGTVFPDEWRFNIDPRGGYYYLRFTPEMLEKIEERRKKVIEGWGERLWEYLEVMRKRYDERESRGCIQRYIELARKGKWKACQRLLDLAGGFLSDRDVLWLRSLAESEGERLVSCDY